MGCKYHTKLEAREAFIDDLKAHKDDMQRLCEFYGHAFCEILNCDYAQLENRILLHDNSKCNNLVEFEGFMLKNYLSDEDDVNPCVIPFMYDKARKSHYENNKDHPEHWLSIRGTALYADEMDDISICEMVLDWIAASIEPAFDKVAVDDFWARSRVEKAFHPNTLSKVDKLIDYYDSTRKSSDG